MKTVVVGLSGGVDSSVAAWLLKQQGHRVIGVFMKNWEGDDDDVYCSSRQDWLDALAVADTLDIEIEAVNFSADYRERVFSEFLQEYAAGRTPNPDILCNSEIKFKAFLDYALRLGADYIATGHYAGVSDAGVSAEEPRRLLRAADASKDQSYFLYRLDQNQLAHACFPLANIEKKHVRDIAASLGLSTAHKKDSTGICFIGERPFRQFLQQYIAQSKGEIVDENGRVLGQHQGLPFYTIGQRKGLGIGGIKSLDGVQHEHSSWYVASKDSKNNRLVVVPSLNHPLLLQQDITLTRCHWIADPLDKASTAVSAKTRYRQKDVAITVLHILPNGDWHIRFASPQIAVTPGQSCVLYKGAECLGGGIIT